MKSIFKKVDNLPVPRDVEQSEIREIHSSSGQFLIIRRVGDSTQIIRSRPGYSGAYQENLESLSDENLRNLRDAITVALEEEETSAVVAEERRKG